VTRSTVALAWLCAFALLGCASGEADELARGEGLYGIHCASCHGANLEGQPSWREPLANGSYPAPPHDGTGHTWRHSDAQLFAATKFGGGFSAAPDSVSGMPGFESVLGDAEIREVIEFVKSRWPRELQIRQRMLTRARGEHHGAKQLAQRVGSDDPHAHH
jgi:mono/diheme cytochrome c family protein